MRVATKIARLMGMRKMLTDEQQKQFDEKLDEAINHAGFGSINEEIIPQMLTWLMANAANVVLKYESQEARERVEIEQIELIKKMNNLNSMLHSKKFETLSQIQQQLLREQFVIMTQYDDILTRRLANWDVEDGGEK